MITLLVVLKERKVRPNTIISNYSIKSNDAADAAADWTRDNDDGRDRGQTSRVASFKGLVIRAGKKVDDVRVSSNEVRKGAITMLA